MKCVTPLSIRHPHGTGNSVRVIVPCGKCGACLQNNRADWSFRLKEELKSSESAWFITLTYKNENLPMNKGIPTIEKKAIQLFIKRVRKEHYTLNMKGAPRYLRMSPVRYYAVGEYGSNTDRPHYHVILFNIHYAQAQNLDKRWQLGELHMSPVSDANIHYITKFHVNKKEDREILDEETGELVKLGTLRQKEFSLMSTNKGIGHQYVERIKQWHTDNGNNYVINNGYKQRVPRYYKGKVVPQRMSPVEKQIYENEDVVNYWEEMKRLIKVKIENPSLYSEMCGYEKAKQLKKKAKNNLTL